MGKSDSDGSSVPAHVGIILDGNRRWAKERGLPTFEGHQKGYETLIKISEAGWEMGISTLSAFVFSTENWNRTKEEVNYLLDLLLKVAVSKKEINRLKEKGVKLVFVGSREGLSKKVLKAINNAEEETKNGDKGLLALHFNYGGRLEIVDAVKSIVDRGIVSAEIDIKTVTDNTYNPELTDADLIIRTSGEQRLSNFMMWRSAYSELYFSPKYWPDFTPDDLRDALNDYSKRQRRHGK
jgi:undecaprenyl diphosphate synthase